MAGSLNAKIEAALQILECRPVLELQNEHDQNDRGGEQQTTHFSLIRSGALKRRNFHERVVPGFSPQELPALLRRPEHFAHRHMDAVHCASVARLATYKK